MVLQYLIAILWPDNQRLCPIYGHRMTLKAFTLILWLIISKVINS